MIFFKTGFIFWRSSGELYFRSSLPLILVDWAPQSRGLREARPEKLSFTFFSEMCTPKNNFRQTSYFIFLAWSFSQSVSFIPHKDTPTCLHTTYAENQTKWPLFSSFLTFTLEKASPVHTRPWLTESECLVWLVLTMVSSACRST